MALNLELELERELEPEVQLNWTRLQFYVASLPPWVFLTSLIFCPLYVSIAEVILSKVMSYDLVQGSGDTQEIANCQLLLDLIYNAW